MNNALIIEDVSDAQVWLGDALQNAYPGIQIQIASSLTEALALIDSELFDIALVDLNLPDGSGIDAIHRLKALKPNTITVVVTIYDDDNHLFPALQAGAQGYLLKDQSKHQISRSLKGVANGEPPLSPAIARRLLNYFGQSTEIDEDVKLTPREQEVLVLIAKGTKLADVAEMLSISYHTVAGYVKEIYRKLNVSSRAEAALEASRLGLLTNSTRNQIIS